MGCIINSGNIAITVDRIIAAQLSIHADSTKAIGSFMIAPMTVQMLWDLSFPNPFEKQFAIFITAVSAVMITNIIRVNVSTFRTPFPSHILATG